MGIVIARYYGARNFTKIKEAVAATWILGALLSIVVMLLGFLGLYPLLQYLDTPAEILPQSYQYISMIVTCVGAVSYTHLDVYKRQDFTSLDGDGILLTSEEMEIFLNKQASSDNQITLLAFLNDKIAGIVNITADQRKRVRHIGDLFIVIGKRYWNNGLGSLLLEEAIEWAQASGILRRLQPVSYTHLGGLGS